MRREYLFSKWEMYIQLVAAPIFFILVLFAGFPLIILIFFSTILTLFTLFYLFFYPLRAVVEENSVTFFMSIRTVTVPITDLLFAGFTNGLWLYYRGGKLVFSAMPTNHALWNFLKDMHEINPKFIYYLPIFCNLFRKKSN